MLIGPEQVATPVRVMPAQVEMWGLRLNGLPARELGLINGQVIEALIASRDGRLMFEFGGRQWALPPGFQLQEGQTLRWRIQLMAGGVLLLPLKGNPMVTASATQRAGLAAANQSPSGASPVNPQPPLQAPSLLALLSAARPAPGVLGALVTALFGNPVRQLIAPERRPATETGTARGGGTGAVTFPVMAQLTPVDVQNGLRYSGIFLEQQLARRQPVAERDLKRLVLRVLASSTDASKLKQAERLLAGIERSQAESVRAASQKEFQLSWVMGFADAPPVEFSLQREPPERSGDPWKWVISMYTETPELGQIWTRCCYEASGQVDIAVWIPEPSAQQLVRGGEADLRAAMDEVGLLLGKFTVFTFAKADEPEAAEERGSIFSVEG